MIPATDPVWMDIRRDRINHAKANLREECKQSEGCEADCFACPKVFTEPEPAEVPQQREHSNRCLTCYQHVLTTDGMDPLKCSRCRDLLESSDPWHRKSWS